ncbi:MAG: amidohydrolase family protein [Saprospiraceae bacterium]|nr:amidohydrolase family protein [Saprospiraceae bacterium]
MRLLGQVFFALVITFFCTSATYAQSTKLESVAITNVTLHLGNGKVIEKGAIGIKDGKIQEVGETVTTANYEQNIDGQGQHVYPGLIAPNSRLGLEEVEAVRSTRDFREVGKNNPSLRSIIAYNTDSHITPTVRSNGILMVQVVPEGGRISGQSSVAYTEAFNWEDAAVALDNCIHLHWPNRFHFTGWWAAPGPTKGNKKYEQNLEMIKVYFDAAKAYYNKEKVEEKNLKFEAMNGLFDKKKKLFIHVDDARSIMEAVELLEPYGMDLVIMGGAESWMITDFMKEKNLPVVLSNVHRLPRQIDEDIDQPYKTPALLQEAGILFAFSMEGSWNIRNLPFQAGQAVGYGLDAEAAIAAMTSNAAQILGISDRVGTLEKGKEATIIMSKGDVMDMRTSVITDAYIQGKKVDLDDKQKALYRKYAKKYGLETE